MMVHGMTHAQIAALEASWMKLTIFGWRVPRAKAEAIRLLRRHAVEKEFAA